MVRFQCAVTEVEPCVFFQAQQESSTVTVPSKGTSQASLHCITKYSTYHCSSPSSLPSQHSRQKYCTLNSAYFPFFSHLPQEERICRHQGAPLQTGGEDKGLNPPPGSPGKPHHWLATPETLQMCLCPHRAWTPAGEANKIMRRLQGEANKIMVRQDTEPTEKSYSWEKWLSARTFPVMLQDLRLLIKRFP